jgi:hypothetical protein
MRWWRR